MKHILSLILIAAASAFSRAGTVHHLSMPSQILGEEKPVTVYLPDGYEDGDASYPVLYLLHGAWGCDRDWTDKGSAAEIADLAIRSGMATPMVIVMPDARGTDPDLAGPHMGYFDQPDWQYEKYFYEELIPFVESEFRIVGGKGARAIAGLSMGGGGAVVYGQRYPHWWGSVCSLSGALGHVPPLSGATETFSESLRRNDALAFLNVSGKDNADSLRSVRWLIDCGDDDFLWEGNIEFYRAMRHLGIPVEFRMRDGAHNWTYWRTGLPAILTFISQGFRQ